MNIKPKREIISGIYKIHNKKSKRTYIGSSKDCIQRLRNHKAMLRHNHHDNIKLQRSWNRNQEKDFQFTIIERCEEYKLEEREVKLAEEYKALDKIKGFNLMPINKRRNNYSFIRLQISKAVQKIRGNFKTFKIIDIITKEEKIFSNLIDASSYIKENRGIKTDESQIRRRLSTCLRGIPHCSSKKPLKTIYKYSCKIIN